MQAPSTAADRRTRHLVLVAPANSYRTGDYLTAADALGCGVTVVTDAATALPGAAITTPFSDPERAAETALRHVRSPVDGVVGTDGRAVEVAGAIARGAGLPTNSAAALRTAADKMRQRRALDAAGVHQPAFVVDPGDGASIASPDRWRAVTGVSRVAGDDDRHARDPATGLPIPVVVKPVDRCAGQGVLLARTVDELDAAVRRVRLLVGRTAPVMIERHVVGREVAVDALLTAGQLHPLAIFDKPDTPAGPTFPETLLISPARLSTRTRAAVLDVVGRAVEAIGLTHGPVHAEVIVGDGRVYFLELAARSIGGLCGRTIRPGGTQLEAAIIRHALGLRIPVTDPSRAVGVLMLPMPARGTLRGITGLDAARAVDGITDVVVSVGSGQSVVPLPDGDRYLGFVFAEADDPDICERVLRDAWARLTVVIDPPDDRGPDDPGGPPLPADDHRWTRPGR